MLFAAFETSVRHKYKEDSTEYVTSPVIKEYLNDCLQNFLTSKRLFQKQYEFTAGLILVNADTGFTECALPADFFDKYVVKVDGVEITPIDYATARIYAENYEEQTGSSTDADIKRPYQRYFIRGGVIGFTVSVANTSSIVLDYFYKHAAVTGAEATNMYDIALDGFEDITLNFVLASLADDDDLDSKVAKYTQRYMNRTGELVVRVEGKRKGRPDWQNKWTSEPR